MSAAGVSAGCRTVAAADERDVEQEDAPQRAAEEDDAVRRAGLRRERRAAEGHRRERFGLRRVLFEAELPELGCELPAARRLARRRPRQRPELRSGGEADADEEQRRACGGGGRTWLR